MAIHNIPLSFKLGGRDWKIVYNETIDDGESYAKWLDTPSEILLARNIKEDGKLLNCSDYQIEHSFWHEIGHIFQYYSEGQTDEKFAQTFATFMMEFHNTKTDR